MKFCQNCGGQIPEGNTFCPTCGGAVNQAPTEKPVPTTDANDTQTEKVLAILSYLGFIGLIFHFAKVCKTDFGKFHALQGTNVFIIEVAIDVVAAICKALLTLIGLKFVGLLFDLAAALSFALSVIGIVYAAQGKKEEIPVIKEFKIIK